MIKVQDGIRPSGWNFGNFITVNYGFSLKVSNFDESASWNKGVQVGKFRESDKVCCTIIWRLKYLNIKSFRGFYQHIFGNV